MLRYLLCIWLAFVNVANADQNSYLTVTGIGNNFQQAKENAFRKAIEFKVGTTVLSDLEIRNYKIAKQEIYLYSAGYVDDYKILQQDSVNGSVVVLMEVLVSESKIKNRIISAGKSSTDFENQKHTAQVGTYMQERVSADRILAKHLAGYPKKAYEIKQQPYNITLNEYRQPVLNIPYSLNWNYEYIKTLREILNTIEHGSNGLFKNSESAVVIMVKDPKDWILGEKTTHKFNDLNTVNQVHNALNGYNQIRIIVRLKDLYNNDIHAICYSPRFISGYGETFYDTGEPRVKMFYGNAKEQGLIKLPVNLDIIDKTSKIELSIDADHICNR